MQALPPLQWSRLVQARYTPLEWKIYFLNLQLSYKKDIPLYNLVKENEQVSFEQNQHIPTSLLEPLPLILPSKIYPLYNGRVTNTYASPTPFTMVKSGIYRNDLK